jgi:SAM-dependent methyltransferase
VTLELRSLLEVGSGFGYTRVAAERAGIRTAGVDVNPEAAVESSRRYGLSTFTGTLDEALRVGANAGGIAPGNHDAVLYQFVLEHVVDPARELAVAARAVRDRGVLALLVPNMAAAEVDVFGASYRSFRADHRQLFTRASLEVMLARAGFRLAACESHCNLHLFRDFIAPPALDWLYATGRGPDLFVVAEKLS